MNIPFSPPDISEKEIAYVTEALRSGWITTGPRTKELEQKIADWLDVPGCVCLNSQTACAEMVLRLLEIGPGDEVITCAYTYTASASVIRHVGAEIVLVDCQKDSPLMDYDALERAITERTKAIIPVDLGGLPCDYDRLLAILERKKALFSPNGALQRAIGRVAIVEDAAHAFGTVWHGKRIGAKADFTNFSFHAVKNFTTAEGGAVTWRPIAGVDDEEIYRKLQLFSLHGQNKDALAKTKLGAWEYDIMGTWYKCNMTDIAAAIGLAQLERYPALLERRREIIGRYDDAFRALGVEVMPHYTDDYASSGHLYITRVPGITPEQRNDIIIKMAERGVICNVHYKPLPMHTAYKNLGFDIADYPHAYAFFANEITLPIHTCLTDEQVDYVIESYRAVLAQVIEC
ncbi:MAG: DegT/DnrJ/EryC1/StrS family aminotransferase [Oscillospiraceae bacterium]|nr:DegT/DnrJ/EryC1/StrS family aminotransferase [Oscillospiraceae bacterium]